MKIAVNTRLLLKNQMDGIGYFTYETFKLITSKYPEHEFIFIFDRKPHPDFIFSKNITAKVISPQARHPLLYKVWYQYSLNRLLKRINADIFVGTDGMIPLKTRTKTLSVIHDINFHHHPEFLPKKYADFYNKYFKSFAQKATRIATVSEYSKKDICDSYQIEASKIEVVYNGASKNFKPIDDNMREDIQQQYSKGAPYFLFIGTLHPRKNLINLFKAFDEFKNSTSSNFKLVIAGKKMWWEGEIETTFNNLKYKSDVVFTGRLAEQDLYKLTAAAHTLTYVPFFEGFGIPLVEAMSCGVPVITSNTTSMPEVVEDAGLLVNPNSVTDITEAMTKITSNENLYKELSKKSISQAQKFTWDKTADLLWDSIQKTINA